MSGPSQSLSRCIALASVAGVTISCGTSEDLGESRHALEATCTASPVAPVLFFPLELDRVTGVSLESARGLHASVEGPFPELVDAGSPLGPALALTGATSFRTSDDDILDAPKGTFTIGAWVTADALTGSHTIAARGIDGTPGAWSLAAAASEGGAPGALIFRLCGLDGCAESRLEKALPAGEALHVSAAVTLAPDPNGSIAEVVLRAAPIPGGERLPLEARGRIAVALSSFDSDAPLLLGARDAIGADGVAIATDHFVGVLDQMMIWNQPLSSEELAIIEGAIDGGVCAPEPLPPPPLPLPPSISCTVSGAATVELRGGHTGADHPVTVGYTLANCPGCTAYLVTRGTKTGPDTGQSNYGPHQMTPAAGTHSFQGMQHYADWRSIGTWDVTLFINVFQTVNGRSARVADCQDSFSMRVTDTVPAGTWCGRLAVDWQAEIDAKLTVMDDRSQTIAPQVMTAWQHVINTRPGLFFGGAGGDTITGDWMWDCILGGGGADTLRGEGGGDWIEGNEGSDTIDGGTGSDDLFGGIGPDTIRGGQDNDEISGGTDGDTIDGDDGADHIHGDEGNDVLRGDAGNDTLWGDLGNDRLEGGGEGDALHGGANDDILEGGDNNDWIYGDDGNDILRGGAHNDRLYCGAGRDKAKGDGGDDRLEGGDGNDFLKGDDDDDALYGQDGIDRLCAGFGADTNDGGAQTDSCRGNPQTDCEIQASSGSCTDSAWNNY